MPTVLFESILFQFQFSHSEAVNSFIWFGKSGAECFTASDDGSVRWWDTRQFDKPVGESFF
jgi:WD40 repeat protein